MSVPYVVELRGVTKVYSGDVQALRGVDLTVAGGELLAIVGPSGSGKSTMLHMIGTLDRPTSGTVRIDGFDVAGLSDRELSALRGRSLGFVFQQFHLAPGVSALDNVAEGLLYTGTPRRERRERAAAALERVGLGHRLAHMPHQLSGGEQQRVAVARAVAGDPPLLLADEPTGNLDSAAGAEVLSVLRDLHAAGTTIAVITHDAEIAEWCPRRVRVRDGRIVDDAGNGADPPAGVPGRAGSTADAADQADGSADVPGRTGSAADVPGRAARAAADITGSRT
ncbi:ABC transporter ATP-binding protein [Microbispora sp. ATCC PTA-5024]|uniref:ABC transporter ATP-binding protein n=1 Tax=Microbispora sp. ATCC PTA-5024 TaxID=316330 RepID=UPI0003DDA7A5|nr:ABC transporter ATP-binding protein [Microbispora sp. ATCC PTA-5024]ETK35542.1 peptide ABC transporter ATP-binding protein [Microbispora sp. ATCC PTA-5024]